MKTKRILAIGALLLWLFGCSDSLLDPLTDDTGVDPTTEQTAAESGPNQND